MIFRLQKQAVDVAVRYRANGFAASEDAAFFLLLDLMTFFDLFHSKKIDEALDIISKIKVKIKPSCGANSHIAHVRAHLHVCDVRAKRVSKCACGLF